MAAQKKPTPKKKPNPNARGTRKTAERPVEKPAERQPEEQQAKQPQDSANQFWSIMLFALGVLSLLLIVIPGTSAWHTLHTTMFGLFGVASAFIPLILVYTAILIGMQRDIHRRVRRLDATEVPLQALRINSNRFLFAQRHKIITEVIDRHLRHLRTSRFLRTGCRQINLDIVRRRHRGCHHKEEQQEEHEVRHGTHRKSCFYPISSF